MKKNFIVVSAIALLVVAGIFGGVYLMSGGADNASETEYSADGQPLDSMQEEPEIEMTTLPTVNELETVDVTVGDGAEAVAGKSVSVLYKGELMDGTVFDSAEDAASPFVFNLGAGEVIPGWDSGVEGMKVGGVRKLTIPGDMAYGPSGVPGVIPGNATLVFEVTLLDVK